MANTRIATPELKEAVGGAIEGARTIRQALEEMAPRLSAKDRAEATRPPKEFAEVGRKTMQASLDFPDVAKAAGYDPAAVKEDLDNLDVLYPLQQEVETLKAVLDDLVLVSADEAYRASLTFYRVAKAVGPLNPKIEAAIKPMASMFGSVREKAAAPANDAE